ncbi:MAG: AAA family ATPase [Rhodospirillales bacterium]|nr:AAA family ATPase [Rhodospirillales bacterium]MBT7505203.1 AAA family ATPase [Rhodospirillales bacterium]
MSETTRALAGGLFQYDDMAPQQLKGIQDDVSAFAVTGESSAYSQSEIAANQSVGSNAMPMVGRDTELEILMLQWKAVTNGEAKTVWVQSDAGMGKSRLIRALERRLDDENHATLSCYCSGAYSNSPYFSLKGGLRTLLNFGADQTMEETASRISDYLDNGIHQSAMIHLLHDQVPDGLPHLPDDPVTARQALVDAFHALLAYLSNSQPVLFVLEDVQWVDPSTRELMVALLQNGGVAGTMFLIATRPEGTMMPPPGAMTMTLSNLSTNAARQIVRFNLDAESGHSEMTDRIVARGGGNPLFLEELGKTMRQSAEHVSIPNTLQDALTARLDNLGNDKALVQAASVIGRSFNTRALMAVTGKSATELEPALDRLSQADILEPGGDSDHPHMFRHALMQETAYHSILRSSRARLHGALAEAMTGELSDLVSTHPELVAFQFAEAGDREQAAVYWERGGRRAANRLAHVEAIEFFEKAVGTLAETDEGSPKELELRTEIIASMRIADQLDAALVQLDRAQDIALAVGSLQEQAKLYTLRGNVLFPVGETAASLAAHEKALDLAREAGDTGLEARALSGLGDACFVAGDLSMSQTYFGQCLSLAQDAGLDDVFIPNLCMAGHLKMYLSDLSGAREDCIKSAEMAATKDLKRAEMIARGSCLAKVLYELGDYEGSSAALHRAIELCHEQGTGRFLPMYYSYLALNCAELDRGADFERYRNETLAALNTTSSIFAGAASLATLATGAAILGKPNEARLYLQQSDPLAMSHVPIHNLMWHGRFGIEASLRLEDWDEAVRYARQLEKLGGENPIPWAVLFARRGVALAARGRDPDDKDAAKLVLEIEAELQHLGNVTSPHRQFE